MKIKITPTESARFHQLFETDDDSNIIIEDDIKGVFEEEEIFRRRSEYIRSNLNFLIIHDVDKMINFLKTAKRLRNLKVLNRKRKRYESKEEYEFDVSRVFYNSIKSIIKKINKDSK